MVLNGCFNGKRYILSAIQQLALEPPTFSAIAQIPLVEIILLAIASFGQLIELVLALIRALRNFPQF